MTKDEFRKRWIDAVIETAHVNKPFAETYFRQRKHALYYWAAPEPQAYDHLLCLPAASVFFT